MFRKLSLLGALALVVSCSSSAKTSGGSTTGSSTGSSTTASIADSASTTAAASTSASATTSPATTAPAPTTTVAPEPLILRKDGLGPFDFGKAPAEVIDAITAQLGAPARNDVLLYENDYYLEAGYYESNLGPYYYALAFPVGQTVCWTGEFCAEFGGASVADLHFIGWAYSGPPHMLASASNLTIGAEWEDFPSMIVYPTCYNTGGGTHHDIVMVLAVVGDYVPNMPDPAITKVTFLEAGDRPFQVGNDC